VPETYIIQAGDSLSAICATQVPDVPADSCILQIVQMNSLVDPGQIAAGQTLLLPIASTTILEPPLDSPPTVTEATVAVPPATATGRTQALVVRVIDGDTVELGDGSRVRYIGMDTPEATGDCYSQEATARNETLVLGRVVELEKDVSETDQYDRLLRYVYVDGVMVNEVLLAEGYAQVTTYPPDVKYVDRFLAAQQQAIAAGAGLWAGCVEPTITPLPVVVGPPAGAVCPQGCDVPPAGCVIKGNISQSSGEKIYHVPGGGSYEETKISPEYGERWFCTEQEAVANGWRKSRN
jgi:micrococcal nuclease